MQSQSGGSIVVAVAGRKRLAVIRTSDIAHANAAGDGQPGARHAVPLRALDVQPQVESAQRRQKPVEVVQVTPVEVLRGDPPGIASRACDSSDARDQDGAQVVPEPECGQGEGASQASDPVWALLVEELQLPDVGEHLRGSHQRVLRHLPAFQTNNGTAMW